MSCPVCSAVLRESIGHAAVVRAPAGGRVVGPEEAAVWARLERESVVEVVESLARVRRCAG